MLPDDMAKMERYGRIQRLNSRPDPRYHDRAPDRKYGPIATLFLLCIVIFTWMIIIFVARFVFSYTVPYFDTGTETIQTEKGKLI